MVDTSQEISDFRRLNAFKLICLQEEATLEGLSITAVRRAGARYVLDPIENVRVEPYAINVICRLAPRKSVNKSKPISSIGDFVSACGGLEKSRNVILAIMQRPIEKNHGVLVAEYLWAIDYLFELSSRILTSNFRRVLPPPLVYCAFCWKLTDLSKFYCEDHHPESSQKAHQRAKRRLVDAIKKQSGISAERFRNPGGDVMYFWQSRFAEPASSFFGYVGMDVYSDWRRVVARILDFCKDKYPRVYEKVGHTDVSQVSSWVAFVFHVIGIISPSDVPVLMAHPQASSLLSDDYEINPNPDACSLRYYSFYLLEVLQRYESYSVVNSISNKRGPLSGTIYNHDIRKRVLDKMAEYELSGQKRYGAKLARELQISKVSANKYIRELRPHLELS